ITAMLPSAYISANFQVELDPQLGVIFERNLTFCPKASKDRISKNKATKAINPTFLECIVKLNCPYSI
ncbi:hypothetical protein OFC63_30270, partial [Escherichia coli]|nr:hypothetical protein [Escherichia coli]